MRHFLPTIRSDKGGFAALASLMAIGTELVDDELVIDFRYCGFFDANMVAPLEAVVLKISELNEVRVENLPNGIEIILRKNHYLEGYGFVNLPDVNQTTLPYKRFHLKDSNLFAQYLDTHLSGKGIPTMSAGLDKKFRQSIFEMFANCAIHSESSKGVFVCGQYYPQKNLLDLTISDSGIGIRTNARRVLRRQISSIDAIRWALEEGNTSKTGQQPGGFGLKLLQEFIELNRGKVQIVSRQGYYEFSDGQQKFSRLGNDFPGTTINIEIRTNDNNVYTLENTDISSDDIF